MKPLILIFISLLLVASFDIDDLAAAQKGGQSSAKNIPRSAATQSLKNRQLSNKDKFERQQSANAEHGHNLTDARIKHLIDRTKSLRRGSREFKRSQKEMGRRYGLQLVRVRNKESLSRAGELLVYQLSDEGHQWLDNRGYKKARSQQLPASDKVIDIYEVSVLKDLTRALADLAEIDPSGKFEVNTIYELSAGENHIPSTKIQNTNSKLLQLGVIDTGMQSDHAALHTATVIQKNFGRGADVLPRNHGTMIGSIIAMHGKSRLYVADAFSDPLGYADTMGIIAALDWLSKQEVTVINMSLAGPDNQLLQEAIKHLTRAGFAIISAVGNDRKKNNNITRYPAAYEHVLGITAVSLTHQIYDKANQGKHIDFSAYGVDLMLSDNEQLSYSGTSYATPFVSAFIATQYSTLDNQKLTQILQRLKITATDLGEPGHDPIFGHGLITSPTMQQLTK